MTDDHTHRGDDVHSVEAAMLDEAVFPQCEFQGRWEASDPPMWELFDICLWGREAGELITDPPQIHEALVASGYRLTLEKIPAAPKEPNP